MICKKSHKGSAFLNAAEYMLTCLAVFLVIRPIEIHDEMVHGTAQCLTELFCVS